MDGIGADARMCFVYFWSLLYSRKRVKFSAASTSFSVPSNPTDPEPCAISSAANDACSASIMLRVATTSLTSGSAKTSKIEFNASATSHGLPSSASTAKPDSRPPIKAPPRPHRAGATLVACPTHPRSPSTLTAATLVGGRVLKSSQNASHWSVVSSSSSSLPASVQPRSTAHTAPLAESTNASSCPSGGSTQSPPPYLSSVVANSTSSAALIRVSRFCRNVRARDCTCTYLLRMGRPFSACPANTCWSPESSGTQRVSTALAVPPSASATTMASISASHSAAAPPPPPPSSSPAPPPTHKLASTSSAFCCAESNSSKSRRSARRSSPPFDSRASLGS
eukprot:m.277288 g.277288  ORF g.277288 m.277288 type:complete len:338 (+) comp26930_c0_seq10:2523-3536(+)